MARSIATLMAAAVPGARRLVLADAPRETVAYWLYRLSAQLDRQAAEVEFWDSYYRGDHPLQFASTKFQQTFGDLFSEFADNWCQVIVDSSLERLSVQGFRFGADEDYVDDSDAWAIWQANDLDADSVAGHLEAIKTGTAFLIVDTGDPWPRLTVESPREVTVSFQPGNRRVRQAALKRWLDDEDYLHATVYLPEGSYRFRSEQTLPLEQGQELSWEPDEPAQTRNPFGAVVPVLALRNNPGLTDLGHSDLEPVIDLQNAINKTVTDMLVASEFGAFRQRWMTGASLPPDKTGKQLDPIYIASPGSIFADTNKDAKFGDFNVTDLSTYVRATELLVQHLAGQTRVPPQYLTVGLGQWPSGSSLKAAEVGLVAKVRRKQLDFSDTWEEAMRLAFYVSGDERRAAELDAEVIWADPEVRSEGERVDALVKMRALGVPLEALWARWGATPQEIERWQEMAEREAELLRAVEITTGQVQAMPSNPAAGAEE